MTVKMGSEFEDGFLEIIVLLSCGKDKATMKKQLGLSDALFRTRLKAAYTKLKRVSGLSEEAASALIWPRIHGKRSKRNYFPRFSAPAVSVERARRLDAFHDSCQAVRDAVQDMDVSGLSDVADWLGGWRPADFGVPPEVISALEGADTDLALYVWPDGLRIDRMIGRVNSVDLQMIRKNPREGVISGYLLCNVRDPESSFVFYKGASVALHLPPDDEQHWREYSLGYRSGRKAIRVRVSKSDATATLVFNPSEV